MTLSARATSREPRAASRISLLALLATLISVARPLDAQQADVIRGRITGDDRKPVANATVVATSIPNNVPRTATSDREGRFTITFANGEGNYWISVSALGFAPRRFELKRVADEDILVADAKLTAAGVVLDAVRVQADRSRPARNDNSADISGTDRSVANVAVDPSQAGSLAAMAASLPGVQLIPGADGNPDQFSVFGLGGDQNNATLNGLGFGGGEIPRDAATRSTLGTSPWDVSRGGFSGGQIGMRTQSGSNFSSRGLSSLATTPALEWTDRAGRAAGAEYASVSVGAATAGPISIDKSFYSVGYQFDRRSSALPSLASTDPLALTTAGVARDSVSRLLDILGTAGVPRSAAGLPSSRLNDRGLVLASFDFSPPSSTSGQALNVTAVGTFSRLSSPFAQVTALPTSDARITNSFASVQARHTSYFGFGVLTETSIGVSRMRSTTDPYLAMPIGAVRVTSTLDDGRSAISRLLFGGNGAERTANGGTSVAAQNQLSWFSTDNTHRIKLASELRLETFDQNVSSNQLGTFSYNSLADLGAGRPASFSRLLSPRIRSGKQVVGGLAIGDSYRPTPDLQFQYGLRVDGNRFLSSPTVNPALAAAFGASNRVVPNRLYVSPRAGFSWTYGQSAQLPIANGFMRTPRAVVRGGVGVFQNTPNVQLIASALSNTGLAGAAQQLTCVGSAVPVPRWSAYLSDPAAIPARCADGSTGTVFSSAGPEVVLFDDSYAAQRSLRSNLNWSGAVLGNRLAATVEGTYSLNRSQPGMENLNFNPTVRFQLADEGRPVYVQPASIVGSTGAVATQDARRVPAFSYVIEQRSDLSSVNRQVSVGVRPLAFSTRYSWSLTYVYSNTRDVVRGFASTVGDPRDYERGRSSLDSRHQVVYSASYNLLDWIPVSLSGSIRSGRPFTPLVAGDVNGDGLMNDRAFVFDPSRSSLDPSFATAMRSLLSDGSSGARSCLSSQLGAFAARNSCQAPWTATSNLTVALNPVKFRLPQRVAISFYVNNAVGAADLLLHGESKRRGWGQAITPDPTLLYVRGFDQAARTFRYEVNPRFGATSLNQTLNRNPVVVTAQVRMDVGYARERQLLTQSLDRGRGRPGTRSTEVELRGMSGALIPANPMSLLLQQADSLRLTRQQADSISTLNRMYSLAFVEIWTPVAKYLAALPADYDRAEAYSRYRRARELSVDALLRLAPAIRSLLTPEQIRKLPAFVASSLDVRYLAAVRSSTAGGANMGVLGMLAQMGWAGGMVDASSQAVMIHR